MSNDQYRPPIVDEIWALVKENQEGMKKLRASQEETIKQLKKTDARFNDQWGKLIESLVAGKLVELLQNQKISVSRVSQRAETFYKKPNGDIQKREFDIVVLNGSELVLVEVKTTLKPDHVDYFLEGMRDIKKHFPDQAKKKAYGAVAYLSSSSKAHIYAERQGLFVIRATGDSASIINQSGFKPKAF